MIIRKDSWALILVGYWNRFILSPDWTSRLFEEQELNLEYPVNDPSKPLRYRFLKSNIIFIPANHRVSFVAQPDYSDGMLSNIAIYTKRLVNTLSHTPIRAMGINFSFEIETREFNHLDLFRMPDADRLSEVELVSEAFEVKRQFAYNQRVLNLNIANRDKLFIDFNYHYEVPGAQALSEILYDNIVVDNKSHALRVLDEVYDLRLANEEEV